MWWWTPGSSPITGYCYGGSVVWAAAGRYHGLSAASGYYGGNIGQMIDLNPKCPTILHFGKEDHGIPMEVVHKVEAAHPDVKVYVYPAGHGFNSDRRTDYHEESAKLARKRTLELFHANGKASARLGLMAVAPCQESEVCGWGSTVRILRCARAVRQMWSARG